MTTLPKRPTHSVITLAEISLQYSDTLEQRSHDIAKVTNRLRKNKVFACGGTEALQAETRNLLKTYGRLNGFDFYCAPRQDAWVLVRSDAYVGPGEMFYRKVIDGKAGLWSPKGVTGVTINAGSRLGPMTFMPLHWMTKGRPDAKDPEYRKRLDMNRQLAKAYAEEMRTRARGKALGFALGDTNIPDNVSDVFLGHPFTTAGDDLKRHPSTGHGPIDVIARWDADRRVSFTDWRVYNDQRFLLHSDHFYVEADVKIEHLK